MSRTFNNTGFKRQLPSQPLTNPPRTCGHWPAPHQSTNDHGEKQMICSSCYRERTATS